MTEFRLRFALTGAGGGTTRLVDGLNGDVMARRRLCLQLFDGLGSLCIAQRVPGHRVIEEIVLYPREGLIMSEWRNLGERTVYENRWVTVNMADVELPDGRHLDHTVIRLRPVAVATVVNEKNEALLLWRHRFIADAWGWELPSGGTGEGEDPAAAAAREFEEETGWRPGPMQHLMSLDPQAGISTSRHHVYWSDRAQYVGHPADDFESSRREWVPLRRVPELVNRGEIRSANAVAALMMLHHLRLG